MHMTYPATNWSWNFPQVAGWGRTSGVTPADFDESWTQMAQLAEVREVVDKIIKQFNEQDLSIAELVDSLNATFSDFAEKFQENWGQYQDDVRFMIESSHDNDISYNPTNGSRHEPIDIVVNNTFDNTRYYAYFAKQYDELGMTAKEYDELDWSARHFDLAPLDYINDTLDG